MEGGIGASGVSDGGHGCGGGLGGECAGEEGGGGGDDDGEGGSAGGEGGGVAEAMLTRGALSTMMPSWVGVGVG